MLATGRARPARVVSRRNTLRACLPVVPEIRSQTAEVRFKGVEQGERCGRADEIIVAAKAEGVAVMRDRKIVDQLKAGFTVEIRVTAVHAGGEGIRKFEVRLRGDRREVKG